MGGGYFSDAVTFLIQTIFGLYLVTVMLRFFLQQARVEFYYNPLARALVTLTNPALRPLRRLIPGFKGIDWAAIVLMLLVQLTETLVIVLIHGHLPRPPGLLIVALAELISTGIYVYLFAILIQVIASWLAPQQYNPVLELVERLTEPLMRPVRPLIPPIGGLDFSALAVMVLLQLTVMLIVNPLRDVGYGLI